ncbi:MAG TPA: type II toxin-antitoxin system RatA family toxin [Steroidobacteraceae bacterium]|nr:type II toxin-antitoxin system RatA family toxin [Steroidobacteraceae bacterium]
MREVRRNALVPHTPAQMYALVNDVARYPDFVPWCPATRIHAETANTITATVEIERAGVRIGLTTRNTMRPGERIEMTLIDGPLRSFGGTWDFIPIRAAAAPAAAGEVRGCRVELAVSFEFRNAALSLVLGPVFESSWDSLVDAFVRRAREVYRG